MSVYSGFATRQNEESYYKTLYNLVYLMQMKILKIFKNEYLDDRKFCKYYVKLFKKIYELDKIKYLPPKFDSAFKDLAMFIVQRKDDLLERGTNISSSSQLSQSPFQKTFFMSSQLQSLSKDNQNRSRSLLDMEDTQSMKSMALTSLNFSTVAVSQQNDNQNAINLRNNQTIDYPNYSVKNQQNPNITSSIDKNRISLQSIPEFKQQKQQQSKTPQQNSVNKIGRNNAIQEVIDNQLSNLRQSSSKNLNPLENRSLSRIRKGPTSLRNLSQQNDGDSRNRNSRSTLIANKSLNVQKSGTGLTRYRNTKFINESRQDALRYRNNLNHSVELETIQGINHNETVISPQTIANVSGKFARERPLIQSQDKTTVKTIQILQPLSQINTIQNSSTQLNNSTALEAYKSVPLALLPKRKKPYGKLKQISTEFQDLDSIDSSKLLGHTLYNNQSRNQTGSKIIEEEESVNESEGYQSNHFTSINQKIDDSLEQDDKKIVFQLKRGIVGNNTNLKNRFKKLTLSLRKSQNQGIINNLANPYQNVTNANPLNNSSII